MPEADRPYKDVMLMGKDLRNESQLCVYPVGLGFLVGSRITVDTERDELTVAREKRVIRVIRPATPCFPNNRSHIFFRG